MTVTVTGIVRIGIIPIHRTLMVRDGTGAAGEIAIVRTMDTETTASIAALRSATGVFETVMIGMTGTAGRHGGTGTTGTIGITNPRT